MVITYYVFEVLSGILLLNTSSQYLLYSLHILVCIASSIVFLYVLAKTLTYCLYCTSASFIFFSILFVSFNAFSYFSTACSTLPDTSPVPHLPSPVWIRILVWKSSLLPCRCRNVRSCHRSAVPGHASFLFWCVYSYFFSTSSPNSCPIGFHRCKQFSC